MLADEQCPICRKFNPAQTVLCPNCGVQLIFAGDQTQLGSPPPLPPLKCNDCGEQNDARSTRCCDCNAGFDGYIVYMVTLDKPHRGKGAPMTHHTPPTQRPRWRQHQGRLNEFSVL